MATISHLEGLAEKWEEVRGVRGNLQRSDHMMVPARGMDNVEITVKCAGENEPILMPLMPYLQTQDGIGMVSIPALENESFGSGPRMLCFLRLMFIVVQVWARSVGLSFRAIPVSSPSPYLRLAKLHRLVGKTVINFKAIKLTAWHIKKFAVLIKKKVNRDQYCRDQGFRNLMAALQDGNGQSMSGLSW